MKTEEQLTIPTVKNKHGGARAGSGRPKGSGTAEPTKAIRVPVAILEDVKELINQHKNRTK